MSRVGLISTLRCLTVEQHFPSPCYRLDLYLLLSLSSLSHRNLPPPPSTQSTGLPADLPPPLAITTAPNSGSLVLHSGHTHFLFDIKDTVTMVTNLSHAVPVEVVGEKGAGLDVVLGYGEGWLGVRCRGGGGEEVEELSQRVELLENRGRPLKVWTLWRHGLATT